LTIAGKDGKDAKIYLEKQLKQRLARLEELQGTVAKCRNGAISRWFVGFRASTQPTITHDKTSRVRSHIPLVCWVSCLNPTYDYPLKQQAEAHQHTINDEVICLLENFRNQTTHNPEVGSDERFLAIMETSRRCSVLPRLDSRSPEEIIGYNENGIPT
jgi:hypothetical protein